MAHQGKRRERARGKGSHAPNPAEAQAALRTLSAGRSPSLAPPTQALLPVAAAEGQPTGELPCGDGHGGARSSAIKPHKVIKRRRRNSWKMTHLAPLGGGNHSNPTKSAASPGGNSSSSSGSGSGENSPTMMAAAAAEPEVEAEAECQCEHCMQMPVFPDSFLSLIEGKFESGPLGDADLDWGEVANFELQPHVSLPDPRLVSQL